MEKQKNKGQHGHRRKGSLWGNQADLSLSAGMGCVENQAVAWFCPWENIIYKKVEKHISL